MRRTGCARGGSTSICPALRTVWVSFDVIGLDCLEAAAASGAEVVGVVTLPGPVDPDRSGQCSFDDAAARLGAELIEAADINAPDVGRGRRRPRAGADLRRRLVAARARAVHRDGARGVYGMHPTLLPRHRGRAPIPWAILSGLATTGVTLFEITDPTADSGPIVGQVEVPIARDETATTLYERLADAHVELVRDAVPRMLAGSAPRLPQDVRRASSWPKRTPPDGIIDWKTRAPYLYDWVRAQTRPYPGRVHVAGRREGGGLARTAPSRPRTARPPARSSSGRPDGASSCAAATARSCSRRPRRARELEVGAVLG